MNKKWFLFLFWSFWAIYGLIFNPTFIDEAKYLIKGYLIMTGEISYYQTAGFLYQHMPLSLLWFGLGQKIFEPGLLIGRIQGFLIGLVIPFFVFKLGNKIGGRLNGFFSLILITLLPVPILYYSSATPTSLIALFFILAFICLYERKILLSSLFFSLLFLIRENFIFTLVFYLAFLCWYLRSNFKYYLFNLLFVSFILAVFILPGKNEIFDILKNLPGVSSLLPITVEEKIVLSSRWQTETYSFGLYFKALKEFLSVYRLLFLTILLVLFKILGKKHIPQKKTALFIFLIFIAAFNFLAHYYASFNSSPRSVVHYFSYISPLWVIILGFYSAKAYKNLKITSSLFYFLFFIGFIFMSLPGLAVASIFVFPSKNPDLLKTRSSAKMIKSLIPQKQKVFWLAEPITIYLAGGKTYNPLINHINFFKPSSETAAVRKLGYWNKEMMSDWLKEVDFVFIEPNKLKLLSESVSGKDLTNYLNQELNKNFQLVKFFNDDNYFSKLMVYKKSVKIP